MRFSGVLSSAWVWAFTLFLAGCELLGPENGEKAGGTTGVLVVNQGNFSDGNGSVMIRDSGSGIVTRLDADFGSILQSATVMNGRLFVSANSADRIDVFDLKTWQRVGRIDGVLSPRYFAQVHAGKAYVTNLFKSGYSGGSVTILDLDQLVVTGRVDVGDNPEGIFVHDGMAYVANHGFGWGSSVSVLDAATDVVVETLEVSCDGPRSVVVDLEDDVWVFCTGRTLYDDSYNEVGHTDGRVLVLRRSGEEVARFDFSGALGTIGPGQDVAFSPELGLAFAVGGNEIHLFDTATNARLDSFDLPEEASAGAVAYDHVADRIYVGHVPGFVSSGFVTVHARSGKEEARFAAGVAPSFITFLR